METAIRVNTTTSSSSSLNAARRKREADVQQLAAAAAEDDGSGGSGPAAAPSSASLSLSLMKRSKSLASTSSRRSGRGAAVDGQSGDSDSEVLPPLLGHVAWISPLQQHPHRSAESSSQASRKPNSSDPATTKTTKEGAAAAASSNTNDTANSSNNVSVTMFVFGGMDGEINKVSNRTYAISLSSLAIKQSPNNNCNTTRGVSRGRSSSPVSNKDKANINNQNNNAAAAAATPIALPLCDADLVVTPTAPPGRYLHAVAVANPLPASFPARVVASKLLPREHQKQKGDEQTQEVEEQGQFPSSSSSPTRLSKSPRRAEKNSNSKAPAAPSFLSRSAAANAALPGAAYMYGGVAAGFYCDDLWCFDPTTQSWSELSSCTGDMPGRRCGHSMAFSATNEHLYIAGGADDEGTASGQVWCLEMAGRHWRLLDVGVSARTNHRMIPLPLHGDCCLAAMATSPATQQQQHRSSSPAKKTCGIPVRSASSTLLTAEPNERRQQQEENDATTRRTWRTSSLGGIIVGHGGARSSNSTAMLTYTVTQEAPETPSLLSPQLRGTTTTTSNCSVKFSASAITAATPPGAEGATGGSGGVTVLSLATVEQRERSAQGTSEVAGGGGRFSSTDDDDDEGLQREIQEARVRATQLVSTISTAQESGSKKKEETQRQQGDNSKGKRAAATMMSSGRSSKSRRAASTAAAARRSRSFRREDSASSDGKVFLASLAAPSGLLTQGSLPSVDGQETEVGSTAAAAATTSVVNSVNHSYNMHVSASGRYLYEIGGSKDIGVHLSSSTSSTSSQQQQQHGAGSGGTSAGEKPRVSLAEGSVRVTDLRTQTILVLSTKELTEYALRFKRQQFEDADGDLSSGAATDETATSAAAFDEGGEEAPSALLRDAVLKDLHAICDIMRPQSEAAQGDEEQEGGGEEDGAGERQSREAVESHAGKIGDEEKQQPAAAATSAKSGIESDGQDELLTNTATATSTAAFASTAVQLTLQSDCTTQELLHAALNATPNSAVDATATTTATTTSSDGARKNRTLEWLVSGTQQTAHQMTSKHHHPATLPESSTDNSGAFGGTVTSNSTTKETSATTTTATTTTSALSVRNPYRLSNVLGLEGATMCALPSSVVAALAGVPDVGPYSLTSSLFPHFTSPNSKASCSSGQQQRSAQDDADTNSAAATQYAHVALLSSLGFIFGGRDAATGVMSSRLYLVKFFDDQSTEALFESEKFRVRSSLQLGRQLELEDGKTRALHRLHDLTDYAAALETEIEELQKQEKKARAAGRRVPSRGGTASGSGGGDMRKMPPSTLLLRARTTTTTTTATQHRPGGTSSSGSVLDKFDVSLDDAVEESRLLHSCELPILTRHIRSNRQRLFSTLQGIMAQVEDEIERAAADDVERQCGLAHGNNSSKGKRGSARAKLPVKLSAASLQQSDESYGNERFRKLFFPLMLHFVASAAQFFDFSTHSPLHPPKHSSPSLFLSSPLHCIRNNNVSVFAQCVRSFLASARPNAHGSMRKGYQDAKAMHTQDNLHLRRRSSAAFVGCGFTGEGTTATHDSGGQQQRQQRRGSGFKQHKSKEEVLEENSKTGLRLNTTLAESVERTFASARHVQLPTSDVDVSGAVSGSFSEQYVLYRSPSTNKWRRRRATAVFGDEQAEQQRHEEAKFRKNVEDWERQTSGIDLHTRYEALMAELRPYGLHKATPVSDVVMQTETMKTLRSFAPAPPARLSGPSSSSSSTTGRTSYDPDPLHVPMSHSRDWYRPPVVTTATKQALAQRVALSDAAAHDYAVDYKQGVDTRRDSRSKRSIAESERLSRRIGLSGLSQLRRIGDDDDDDNNEEHQDGGNEHDVAGSQHQEEKKKAQVAATSAAAAAAAAPDMPRRVFSDRDFAPPETIDPALVSALDHETAHDRFARAAHRRSVLRFTREAVLRGRFELPQPPHRYQPPGHSTVDYHHVVEDDDADDGDGGEAGEAHKDALEEAETQRRQQHSRALSPTALAHYLTTQHTVPRSSNNTGGVQEAPGTAAVVNAHSDNGSGLISARAAMDGVAVFTMDGIRRSLDGTAHGRLTRQAMVEATRSGDLGEYLGWGNRVPLRPAQRTKQRPSRMRM